MKNKIGIWMDHAEARFIDGNKGVLKTIQSPDKSKAHIAGEENSGTRLGNFRSTNNEVHIHNREQNDMHSYYKQLAKELHDYDDIYVFGPTTAPKEFQNYLNADKVFLGKRINVESADYLTDNQLAERVRKYFDKQIQ